MILKHNTNLTLLKRNVVIIKATSMWVITSPNTCMYCGGGGGGGGWLWGFIHINQIQQLFESSQTATFTTTAIS